MATTVPRFAKIFADGAYLPKTLNVGCWLPCLNVADLSFEQHALFFECWALPFRMMVVFPPIKMQLSNIGGNF